MKEITAVLHKHAITRGVSPEKLRMILEDLGPTYIKLGQIMSLRSDILPKRYCDELMKLCSDVAPMPFDQVVDVIQDAFGCLWQEEFQSIEEKPLGFSFYCTGSSCGFEEWRTGCDQGPA